MWETIWKSLFYYLLPENEDRSSTMKHLITFTLLKLFFMIDNYYCMKLLMNQNKLSKSQNKIAGSDRIVNGVEAADGAYPFYVQVFMPGFTCGGTIISEREVLTAAHCVYDEEHDVWVNASDLQIRSGDFTYSKWDERTSSMVHFVDNYTKLQFNRSNPGDGYDIVLLYTDADIQMDAYRQPLSKICNQTVPADNSNNKSGSNPTGRKLTIIGLGQTDSRTGARPEKLMEADLPGEEDENMCRANFDSNEPKGSAICVRIAQDLKSFCFGDSGGPLLQKDEATNKVLCLYGVTSYFGGKNCGEIGHYNVFERVSFYMPLLKPEPSGINGTWEKRPYPSKDFSIKISLCRFCMAVSIASLLI